MTTVTGDKQRRSARLAAKPTKSYKQEDPYDSEDIADDAEVEDERDEDYVPQKEEDEDEDEEEDELTFLFRKYAKGMRRNATEIDVTSEEMKEIVDKFKEYTESRKDDKAYMVYPLHARVKWYVKGNTIADRLRNNIPSEKGYNAVLYKALFMKEMRSLLMRCAYRMNLEYDDRLLNGLYNWHLDPSNRNDVAELPCTRFGYRRHSMKRIAINYVNSIPKKCAF
jgi:hypothetical protein